MNGVLHWLAHRRVPLGFACAVIAYAFAQPTAQSIGIGCLVALPGEIFRIWAAGHIDKGREVTRSGPYRLVRHPLYLGSVVLGLGFIVAARSAVSGVVVAVYLAVTLIASIRTEEAGLERKFGGEYAAYREGRAAPVERPFRLERVWANREHRAVAGFGLAMGLLALRGLL
jgi:protein-S-isoprenylcysteine O-methyltransferase Ste14